MKDNPIHHGGIGMAEHLNAAQHIPADMVPVDGGDILAQQVPAMDDVEPSIAMGSVIWQVRNTDLACCLLAVGIKLREDPPYTHVEKADGTQQWTFLFHDGTEDGVLNTGNMIEAFSQDMKFITEHPDHPFTFAMCAVKNTHSFKQHMNNDVPFIGFRSVSGRAIMYVKKDSRKHRNAIRKGLRRI